MRKNSSQFAVLSSQLKAQTGAELIAAERRRQIEVEGWTAEHDAGHTECELLDAALCYAGMAGSFRKEYR